VSILKINFQILEWWRDHLVFWSNQLSNLKNIGLASRKKSFPQIMSFTPKEIWFIFHNMMVPQCNAEIIWAHLFKILFILQRGGKVFLKMNNQVITWFHFGPHPKSFLQGWILILWKKIPWVLPPKLFGLKPKIKFQKRIYRGRYDGIVDAKSFY